MVTTILLGVTIFFQFRETHSFAVGAAVPLYILIIATFLLSIIYAISLPLLPELRAFSFLQVLVDVVYATILIYFTGGASSVFTLIYIFTIIAAGTLHFRRGALVIASIAAVLFGLLVAFQFHGLIPASKWPWVSPWSMQTPGYVLWILIVHFTVFYVVALLAGSGAEQLQKTRFVLTLKESDYEKLSDLHTSIVRSIPSGIITTDETDRVTFVNSSGAALLATSLTELVSTHLHSIFPVIETGFSQGAAGKKTYLTVKEIRNAQSQIELTVTELTGSDGHPRGKLAVFHDVTLLRKMEERVKISEKQASFVRIAAGMAHEVRNPLAALRAATELLTQYSPSTDNEKRLLGIVIREADRLNSLLGDFLATISKQQPNKVRVMLTDLLEETVELFAREPRVGREISLETLINKGVEVEGEPARLKQALWNLFTNALDATQDGGVIRVILETEQKAGQAVIRVQDSGCGIPVEIKDRIFEPFTTTKERGAGLGLSMVLNVVRSHNGHIEADSVPGNGSMFTVRLPLAGPEANGPKGEQPND
jgi:two-component system, NtrC family, sensor histidine kinase PilS